MIEIATYPAPPTVDGAIAGALAPSMQSPLHSNGHHPTSGYPAPPTMQRVVRSAVAAYIDEHFRS